jgi:fucose permease
MKEGLSTETAAKFASLFFIGITVGRAISGFLTIKLNDTKMIRLGQFIILIGAIAMLLPLGRVTAMGGLILIGLGCAPIYPCVIHSTPTHFGADKSQAIIGVQMASAYVGILVMPPLFGLIADYISVALLPIYLLIILIIMIVMNEKLNRIHIN